MTRSRAGDVGVVLACLLLGLLLSVGSALVDRDVVTERAPGGGVAVQLGVPLPFVEQQQQLDPPLPYEARLGLPQEHPTALDPVALGVDVLAYAAVLLLLAEVVRRRRFSRPASRSVRRPAPRGQRSPG